MTNLRRPGLAARLLVAVLLLAGLAGGPAARVAEPSALRVVTPDDFAPLACRDDAPFTARVRDFDLPGALELLETA